MATLKNEATRSQIKWLREQLEAGKSVTIKEARVIGCERLASRVFDLKYKGIPVKCQMEAVIKKNGTKTRIARYFLEKEYLETLNQ